MAKVVQPDESSGLWLASLLGESERWKLGATCFESASGSRPVSLNRWLTTSSSVKRRSRPRPMLGRRASVPKRDGKRSPGSRKADFIGVFAQRKIINIARRFHP